MFPSLHPEAFGIVAAEAMASGLALVSTGVGGASEVFEDGISGLHYPAGNSTALAQRAGTPGLRPSFASAPATSRGTTGETPLQR